MIKPIRKRILSDSALRALFISALFCGHLTAADDPKKDEQDIREQQLKNMKRSAAQFTLSLADDRKRQFKFHENAVMRWSNPVGTVKDGAVYIWSDRGRPQAIFKLYTFDDALFSHEWQSLTESPIVAESDGKTVWNPTEPGIKYVELPDASKPAETAAERLRQMKALAGKFSATYTHVPITAKPDELRLLTQPLFRFETSGDPKCLDGALFGFSQGTDPQGLLLFEARKIGETHRWHYAFARMATGSVKARLREKEIFSAEKYDFMLDPKQTFLWKSRQPVPAE
jgi:hypothetical protein